MKGKQKERQLLISRFQHPSQNLHWKLFFEVWLSKLKCECLIWWETHLSRMNRKTFHSKIKDRSRCSNLISLKYIFTGFFKCCLIPFLLCLLTSMCHISRIHTSHMKEEQCGQISCRVCVYQSFFTMCFWNMHALKTVMVESAELLSLSASRSQQSSFQHQQQSYKSLILHPNNNSPWQFLFATEALWGVSADIKVPQWITSGSLQWSKH